MITSETALAMLNSVHALEIPIDVPFKHLCEKIELIKDQDAKQNALDNFDQIIEKFAWCHYTGDEQDATVTKLRNIVKDNVTIT